MNWNDIRRYGTGVGIEIRADDLRVIAVKSRPGGVSLLGVTTIEDVRGRPAAEWGAEYAEFLNARGLAHLAATVCLPRRDVVLRQIQLPAVAGKELAAAIRYQLDGLHPFGDEPICFAAASPAAGQHLVAITLEETVDAYADRFGEAGVAVAAFTVAPVALHAALRARGDHPPRPLLIGFLTDSRLEVYGESAGRPLLSAEINLRTASVERAIELALADMRVDEDAEVVLALAGEAPLNEDGERAPLATLLDRPTASLTELLPVAASSGLGSNLDTKTDEELDWSRDLIAGATALEAACPRLGLRANLLPEERRQSDSRWRWAPTAALAAILALLAVGFAVRPMLQDGAYAAELEERIARLDEILAEADATRARTVETRQKLATLQALGRRTAHDLRILNELSLGVPDSAWLTSLEIDDDGVRLAGEAVSAAPLLGAVNDLGSLEGAAFATSLRKIETGESFQITAERSVTEVVEVFPPLPAEPGLVEPEPVDPEPKSAAGPKPEAEPEAGMLETLGEEAQ